MRAGAGRRIHGGGHRPRLPRSIARVNREAAEALTGAEEGGPVPLGCILAVPRRSLHRTQWPQGSVRRGTMLVAEDVVGGAFALNGGRLSAERQTIAQVWAIAQGWAGVVALAVRRPSEALRF